MNIFQKLCFWRRKEEIPKPQPERSFSEYREAAPEVLRYLRRAGKIARRDLELIVTDNEEEAAWQVAQVAERLLPEVKLMTIVTRRPEFFEELAQDAFEEYGLLVVVTDARGAEPAGNLRLDLHDWEKQLDILLSAGYNNILNQ